MLKEVQEKTIRAIEDARAATNETLEIKHESDSKVKVSIILCISCIFIDHKYLQPIPWLIICTVHSCAPFSDPHLGWSHSQSRARN